MAADPTTRQRRRRVWPRRVAIAGVVIVAIVAVAVTTFILATRNPAIDAFYDPPDDVVAAPGTILRSERFDRGIPDNAEAWKVLYATTDPAGQPIAVSGLIIAPRDPGPGPHPVLAWAHGTTGIARACAPSISKQPLEGIPDMTGALAQGWVLALTDYPGLGTPGPHPYLVGESQGRAVLDSVRAAHELELGFELDDRYSIWGHSQGGHAALFAGQLAADYLPDQELVGVAALAPATDLRENLAAIEGTQVGNVLMVMAVESWTDYYPDIPDGTLASDARRPADRLVKSCINQPSRFRLLLDGALLPDDVLAVDPTEDPVWTARLAENTPDPAGIAVPLFVAQGTVDEVIAPAVTETWTGARCAVGASTEWRTFEGLDHNGVVGPGGDAALAWTIDRFARAAFADVCPTAG